MKRDVSKSLSKYKKYISKHEQYQMYSDEAQQIFAMAEGSNFHCMMYAYKHGFMVGYRAALRDMKKKEGRC